MNDKVSIESFFASPVMRVHLDFDLEKLTEFAFEMWNKDKKGVQVSNKGGWHSNNINKENHKEFIRLKKEIHQYLQIYHTEVFRGMKFKNNVAQKLTDIWININEKYNYNEWHIHAYATLSGTYYIKHDGSIENGDISFRHPVNQLGVLHWQPDEIEACNTVTSGIVTN